MPQYELMYILSAAVSDDQQPEVSSQILQYISDLGGADVRETQLGKKKLMYPIKKTRNGFYGVVNFAMETKKINDLDAKIRTQDNTIIRYILINIDDHLERLAKDREAQAKMSRNRPPELIPVEGQTVVEEPVKAKIQPSKPLNEAQLDEEIEKALTEDITK